jgi:MFS family permease
VASSFSALRHRDYRLLFSGQLISLTGTQMQQVAVAWQLYLLTKSPLSLGVLGAFRIAPVLLFALGGGVIADALNRRRLMIATQSTLAVASLILAYATHSGQMSAATIYAVVAFAGVAVAFDAPARQSLLPLLVPKEELPNALSLNATVWELAMIVGPAIGGTLIDRFGVLPIYLADAVSFGAVIAALLSMRVDGAPKGPGAISFAAALEGLRFLRRTPLISSTMILDFAATFFGGSMLLLPIFADQLLGVGAPGLGLLYAAQPAGAALAAVIMSSRPPIERQGRVLLGSVVLYGLAIAGFGASPNFAVSLVCLALSGAADTISMVIRQTLRQLLTPDNLRGRMTSVNMIFFMGGPQLGEVEAGLVANAFDARISVASGGIACVVAVAVIARAVPALLHLRYSEVIETAKKHEAA